MLCKNIYSRLWIILCTSIDSLLYSRGSLMMLHLLVVTSPPHKCWLSHFCTKMCHRGRTTICSWQKAQTSQNLHPMLNPFPDDQFHLSLRKFFMHRESWLSTFSLHIAIGDSIPYILSNCIVWPSFPLNMPCPISPGIYLQTHSNNLHWLFCYQWFSVACTLSNCIVCSSTPLKIYYSAVCGFLLYTF